VAPALRRDALRRVLVAAGVLVLGVGLAAGARQDGAAARLADPANFTETAPATFRAVFDTSVGMFVIQVHREWAPNGADRFYNLVKGGFYDGCRVFRVLPKFVAQWGIHGNPEIAKAWSEARIPRDRAWQSNTRKRVTFAMSGSPDSRTTQVFINIGDNSRLDLDGFAPFGEVTSSMIIVERLFSGYGEGPDQGMLTAGGNAFLMQYFPQLSHIKRATVER
jgi:peptidyl-prolyl cis-trans isomerase A (cyclophilin A)